MGFEFKNMFGGEPQNDSAKKRIIKEVKSEKRNKDDVEEIDGSRRLFLKTGASIAAAGLISSMPVIVIKAMERFGDLGDPKIPEKEQTAGQKKIDEANDEVFLDVVDEEILSKVKQQIWAEEKLRLEEVEIENGDTRSLNERMALNNRRIYLNGEKIQDRLRDKWLKNYDVGGKWHLDLVNAYSKMQAYVEDLRDIFKKEGVPEEYLYLAIPESSFDENAKSDYAVGAYQFTIQTAEEVGLVKVERDKNGKFVKMIFDHRKDILKSAQACARYLKKKFNQCGDWRLAVAAYNGIVGRYFLTEDSKEARNYNSFVEFIEDDLNEKKKKVEGDFYEYETKQDDTLSKIAEYFKIGQSVLMEDNGFSEKNNIVKLGQKIRIRLLTTEQRMHVFEKIANLQGLGENFNYPAKFEAVWELIKKAERVKFGKNPLLNEKVMLQAKLDRENAKFYTYSVKGGDTLNEIARVYIRKKGLRISFTDLVKIIKKENNLSNDNIKPGQKIKIPRKV